MPTPSETVTAFLAMWNRPGGMAQACRDYFTAETVYENIGLSKTVGPEAAVNFFAQFGSDPSELTMEAETLALAASGSKVLTERIDYILGPDGARVATFPVMGIFEVADGKIIAWRDYFDTAGLAGQQQS